MPQHLSLPSLAALRAFEAAARHESYTRAAEELGVTQGAVSRQVRDLETALGLRLFRREGRAVRLSPAGQALAGELSHDLTRLTGTIARAIAAGRQATLLSIAVLPTFAARWLIPRLPDFRAHHPGIELSLDSRSDPFDLRRDRCDLAIHFGRPEWPGAQLRPLCPEDLVAVAAPALIDRHAIAAPADLLRAPLLHLASRPHLWERFRDAHADGAGALPGMRMDQFAMIISAACAGLGAALLPTYLIEEELTSRRLMRIADGPVSEGEAYWLATPMGAANPVAVLFSNWIARQVSRRF
ncbi:MAG: LysR family transcriptional regulator [Proteobacteria bacterium]|nr:LysR family transcriptional regulator [Pseudomonadota bacterium]